MVMVVSPLWVPCLDFALIVVHGLSASPSKHNGTIHSYHIHPYDACNVKAHNHDLSNHQTIWTAVMCPSGFLGLDNKTPNSVRIGHVPTRRGSRLRTAETEAPPHTHEKASRDRQTHPGCPPRRFYA